jgi:hypothetical protein
MKLIEQKSPTLKHKQSLERLQSKVRTVISKQPQFVFAQNSPEPELIASQLVEVLPRRLFLADSLTQSACQKNSILFAVQIGDTPVPKGLSVMKLPDLTPADNVLPWVLDAIKFL